MDEDEVYTYGSSDYSKSMKGSGEFVKFGFSEEIIELLDLAHARAKNDRVRFITLDHILAVLLRIKNEDFQQKMSSLGIEVARVIENFEVPCQYFRFHIPSGIEFSEKSEAVLRYAEEKAVSEERNVWLIDILYSILTKANKSDVMLERLGLDKGTKPESLYL